MKKFLLKICALVVACAALIGTICALAGCGDSAKYKIGVLLYNFTDVQGQQIQSYGDYLESGFDVDFVYVSVGQDDDSHIQGLESCINQGCNAVFSGYNTAIDRCVEMCESAGVYYGLLLADTATSSISTDALQSKYFLGGVKQFSGDPSVAGNQFAEVLNATDYTQIAGISFPPFAFIDGNTLWNSMVDNLNDDKVICDANQEAMEIPFGYKGDYYYFMFTSDACNATVVQMFSDYPDIEVVVGMGSGMDYVLPALRSNGHSDVKMISLGYTDQVEGYLADGTLLAAGNNNHVECMASLFARAYDALESDGAAWYSDRAAATSEGYLYGGSDGAADYVILTSTDDVADYKNYVIGDKANGPITIDELKNCMLTFNENATWADLTELTTRMLSEITALRAQ